MAQNNQESFLNELAVKTRKAEQLEQWLNGNCIHMRIDGHQHCCPDMSCCHPELLAPFLIRRLYVEAFLKNNALLKQKLLDTFTLYFSQFNRFQTSVDGWYYMDWINKSKRFGIIQRWKLRRELKKRGIKY